MEERREGVENRSVSGLRMLANQIEMEFPLIIGRSTVTSFPGILSAGETQQRDKAFVLVDGSGASSCSRADAANGIKTIERC